MEEWMFAHLQHKTIQPFIMDNCEIPDGEEFDSVRRGVKEKVDTKQTSAIQLANSILNNNKKYADFHMSYRDAVSFF